MGASCLRGGGGASSAPPLSWPWPGCSLLHVLQAQTPTSMAPRFLSLQEHGLPSGCSQSGPMFCRALSTTGTSVPDLAGAQRAQRSWPAGPRLTSREDTRRPGLRDVREPRECRRSPHPAWELPPSVVGSEGTLPGDTGCAQGKTLSQGPALPLTQHPRGGPLPATGDRLHRWTQTCKTTDPLGWPWCECAVG